MLNIGHGESRATTIITLLVVTQELLAVQVVLTFEVSEYWAQVHWTTAGNWNPWWLACTTCTCVSAEFWVRPTFSLSEMLSWSVNSVIC